MLKIDSHQHYWDIARTDYGWLQPSTGILFENYYPERLAPHLQTHGIAATVTVQAAPSVAETDFMLQIADREGAAVAGVVGWLDLEGDSFDADWERLRQHPKFVGIRPMIQDLPTEWLLQERVLERLKVLEAADFTIDLQANPRHLPVIAEVLKQMPSLRAVVDHIAKPAIWKNGEPVVELEPWASQMREIAAYPGIMCKLSGMVPGQQGLNWSADDIMPYAQAVIDSFGKERVMFGSDWPVCLLSAAYDEVVAVFERLVDGWTEEERAAAYGGNAIRFYKLQGVW